MASLEQLPQALLAAIDEVKQVGPSRTEELEVACWVELGALLDHYAAEAAASTETEQQQVAAPRLSAELLGLLPHEMPSSLGQSAKWPDGFSPCACWSCSITPAARSVSTHRIQRGGEACG